MNETPSSPPGRLLTAGGIAKLTGHARMSVYRALKRLRVKPEIPEPVKLYPESVVAMLRETMRKPALPNTPEHNG